MTVTTMSSKGTGWWTRYFVSASMLGIVLFQGTQLWGASTTERALIGLLLVVLPMIFGMGYLLLPSFAGTTLATPRIPGIHFVCAYGGGLAFLVGTIFEGFATIQLVGLVLWTFGVMLFFGALASTIAPVARDDPKVLLRGTATPTQSTKLATGMLPVGLVYLLSGTAVLVLVVGGIDETAVGLQTIVHLYGAGVAFLLILSLGIRLLSGFFHVIPPHRISEMSLLCAAIGPAMLATHLWVSPWFEIGAVLVILAMVGYASIVGFVGFHTDRRRVGIWGIILGAVAGVGGIVVAASMAFGLDLVPAGTSPIELHATLMIDGFLIVTIIGYVYLFYPVGTGRFLGATDRIALTSILFVAGGVGLQSVGLVAEVSAVEVIGIGGSLIGAISVSYLIINRFRTIS